MRYGHGHDLIFSVRDDNGEHAVTAAGDRSLLQALQDADIAIGSVCGGSLLCGTCHVYVFPSGAEPMDTPRAGEIDLLELSSCYRPEYSRLACQVPLDARLRDCRIEVAPDD